MADRAIIPMYDWLGLGAEAHLNTPGKLGGNWSWRAADGFDTAALAKRILAEWRRVLPYITGPETRSVFSSLTKM